jgi:pimeloyl-ACP methyl ester carboxylesterase
MNRNYFGDSYFLCCSSRLNRGDLSRDTQFALISSYDHANFGASDKAPVKLQSVDEVVDDLHAWLKASSEKGPFILVGHSGAGI